MRSDADPDLGRVPRVLWVADKLGYDDRMHGLGAYFLQVLPALPAGRAVPAVLRSSDGLAAHFAEHGVPLLRLQLGKLDPRTLFRLVGLIRREGFELLHLHGYGASTFGRLAAALTGRAAVIHQHDSVMHAPWYGRLCDRLLARWTRRALAVSDSVAEYCVRARSVPRARVEVLANAVAAPEPWPAARRAEWRREQGIPDGARCVASLTRLREEKGVRHLIEAWPAVRAGRPDALLLLFGDGEQRAELERRAAELGVADSIRFLGFTPDAARWLHDADVFTLPSLSEGLPFALLEALAVGKPAVVTAVGGMAELLTDGRDALLVPPADAPALAAALGRALDDPALARALSEGARATAARFAPARHVAALARIYREALDR